ncbi:Lon protease family protein [Rickettsiales bacterium LUAb2]
MTKKLTVDDIYKKCDPNIFNAESTNDIKACDGIIGQERASEALTLAVGVNHSSYNVFALGTGGIGKKRLIRNFLNKVSQNSNSSKDYCYVHNFSTPEKPIYLELNQGEAKLLKQHMEELIDELKVTIPSALNSDSYQSKLNESTRKYIRKQEEILTAIKLEAEKHSISIVKTAEGFAIVAVDPKTQKPLTKEQIEALGDTDRAKIETNIKAIQLKLENLINDLPSLDKEKQEKLQQIKYQTIKKIASPKLTHLLKEWKHNEKLVKYLEDVKEEILSNSEYFYEEAEKSDNPLSSLLAASRPKINRNIFAVNIMVAGEKDKADKSAPIIILTDPNYTELFGKIEHVAQFGSYSTDLTLIKPGSLHLANGGYLVVNARPLLETPVLWYQLKKVIKTQTLPITFDYSYGTSVVTLEPEPIPFKGKIILIGEPDIYGALWHFDPEFKELFKVTAEFNDEVDFNTTNALTYGEIAASIVKKENLKPLDKFALAKLVEIGAREVSSQGHLSANVSLLIDIIRESDYIANNNGKNTITLQDVDTVMALRKKRLSRIPNFIRDRIKDKTILISTEGSEIGQINGLSVMSINEFMFGQPQRLSCSVFKGQKDIIDVERSVNLAGAIYSKAVMIISAFLHGRFSQDELLSFSGTLNFEQSYGKIDGDSASAATTFAILSALSGVPIKQNFAVTGSMDQKGRIQAIGGVNEKIEGFFAICKERGLNGSHGVLIPSSNVKDLMLSEEVRDAVKSNLFNIYALDHVDQGLEILTGKKVGEKDKKGKFPTGTINAIIQKRWVKKLPKKLKS